MLLSLHHLEGIGRGDRDDRYIETTHHVLSLLMIIPRDSEPEVGDDGSPIGHF
jgi:hypothetical protein